MERWHHYSTSFTIAGFVRSQREKGKKGKKQEEISAAPTEQELEEK
jgi:hypothetical protein